ALAARPRDRYDDADRALFAEFRAALARGEIRAAERRPGGAWCVNTWVKQGILLGFRMGTLVDMSPHPSFPFFDKDTYPVRPTTLQDDVRLVPGGSSIRDGAYVAPGVICMPPMYVNVGAYVDAGTTGTSRSKSRWAPWWSRGRAPRRAPPRRGGASPCTRR